MVAETQVPGASVSIVAQRHDVNSNPLFRWRRQLLPKAVVESGVMVPVEIGPDGGQPRRPDRDGVIEIVFGCGHGCDRPPATPWCPPVDHSSQLFDHLPQRLRTEFPAQMSLVRRRAAAN
jgi:hypothetical protein